MSPSPGVDQAALVLGSGGARAAYEVGVARFLFEDLPRQLGHPPDVRVFCGTSAGALNASILAAFAHQPLSGVALLARRWSEMRLDQMGGVDWCPLLRLLGGPLGGAGGPPSGGRPPGPGAPGAPGG